MNRNLSISLTLVAALLVIIALGFLGGRAFRNHARQAPSEAYTRLEPAPALPDFELHDHNGRPFGLKQLAGKWSLVFFGYTHCPDICPTTLVVLRDVERAAGGKANNLQYVFVSVDPDRDRPATLKTYVSYFHPDFIGATGTQTELMRLTRALGAYYEAGPSHNGSYEVQHSAAIFLIDPDTKLRALFSGPHDAAQIVRGLKQLRGD